MENLNEEKSEKKISRNTALIFLVILLIFSNAATAVFYFLNNKSDDSNKTIENLDKNQKISEQPIDDTDQKTDIEEDAELKDFDGDGLSDLDEIYEYRTNPKLVDTDGDGFSDKEEVDSGNDPLIADKKPIEDISDLTEGEIIIEWKSNPAVSDYKKLFGYDDLSETQASFYSSLKVYNVGQVTNGKYKDDSLYVLTHDAMDMGFRGNMIRAIKHDNDEIVFLQKHVAYPDYYDEYLEDTSKYWGNDFKKLKINNQIVIKNLTGGPDIIPIPDSEASLVRIENIPLEMLLEVQEKEELFKYAGDKFVYKDKSSDCFIIAEEDGSVAKYMVEMDFVGKPGDPTQYSGMVPSQIAITWDEGEENKDEYIFLRMTGCGGSTNCSDYVDYISSVDELLVVGKTSTGDNVYELKDKEFKKEENAEALLKTLYKNYYPGWEDGKQKEKITYEEFLASHPLVFWQDPFGDFIQFQKASYLPAVECGKPVIYLYPEEEMDISVRVEPTGGFKITEPDYNDGWLVKAKPNGELFNYSDNENYPYLFWEGYGIEYDRPEEGFMVKRDDVHKFLVEKLTKLGLVKQEYDEFIEFWLPRMQDKPFYFVTFVSKEDFDKIAPLSVEPSPDTVIRVFMDYEGLDYPLDVVEQKIVTPERIGFVVAEWGGAMHR